MPSSRRPARPTSFDQPLPFGTEAGPVPVRPGAADAHEPDPAGPDPKPGGEAAAPVEPAADRSAEDAGGPARRSARRRQATTREGLTSEQRVLRARLAAYHLHATHDPVETTRKAREVFMSRFEREADPDGVLPPAERARRTEAARRAYFTGLALQSSRARRRAG